MGVLYKKKTPAVSEAAMHAKFIGKGLKWKWEGSISL